jgi:hypothetical protein
MSGHRKTGFRSLTGEFVPLLVYLTVHLVETYEVRSR